MNKMTITEALSEINLIKKKLEHKKKSVGGLLMKPDHIIDPYRSEGGTMAYVSKELQAIDDLQKRLIKIRGAISKANCEHDITIGERTQSIHDWLTWKREISKDEISFTNMIVSTVNDQIKKCAVQPQVYEDAESKKHLVVWHPMVDLPTFIKKQEMLSELFENLDGQLSLNNATIVITF